MATDSVNIIDLTDYFPENDFFDEECYAYMKRAFLDQEKKKSITINEDIDTLNFILKENQCYSDNNNPVLPKNIDIVVISIMLLNDPILNDTTCSVYFLNNGKLTNISKTVSFRDIRRISFDLYCKVWRGYQSMLYRTLNLKYHVDCRHLYFHIKNPERLIRLYKLSGEH